MILVQRRNDLFDAIIRELKRARVPVAGADLLRIGGELAVNDLLAALRFAATRGDDLSLAALLRSPLGGLSERELFELAHPRGGTLWQALRAAPAGRWPEVRALLADLRDRADYLRPFELLTRILVRHGGRRRLVARLGREAEDGIDALLDQALAYESVEAAEPHRLSRLDRPRRGDGETPQRRGLRPGAGDDRARRQGPRGADRDPARHRRRARTARNPPQILRLAGGQPVWRVPSDVAARRPSPPPRRPAARWSARRTGGCSTSRSPGRRPGSSSAAPVAEPKAGSESWHALVAEAMAGLGARREPHADGEILALDHRWSTAPAGSAAPTLAALAPLADWTRRAAASIGRAATVLTSLGARRRRTSCPRAATGLLSEAEAMARGSAVHRLLEGLHGRPAADRARARRAAPARGGVRRRAPGRGGGDPRRRRSSRFAVRRRQPRRGRARGAAGAARRRADRRPGRPAGRRRPTACSRSTSRATRRCPTRRAGAGGHPAADGRLPRGARGDLARAARIETAILWTRSARLMPLPDALLDAALARAALAGAATRP